MRGESYFALTLMVMADYFKTEVLYIKAALFQKMKLLLETGWFGEGI